jgi:hypothetical protein
VRRDVNLGSVIDLDRSWLHQAVSSQRPRAKGFTPAGLVSTSTDSHDTSTLIKTKHLAEVSAKIEIEIFF